MKIFTSIVLLIGLPAAVTYPQPPACIVNSASSEHPDDVNSTNDEARAAAATSISLMEQGQGI